jgi:hypothetical protein
MKYLLFIVLLVVVVMTAGCVSENKNVVLTPTQTPEIKLSTIEPSEMALQLSDLPQGYVLKERVETTESGLGVNDSGWLKGFSVTFDKMDSTNMKLTIIRQRISIYSIDKINSPMSIARTNLVKTSDPSFPLGILSDPKIGDSSQAFKIKVSSENFPYAYSISFVKKDVFEDIVMISDSIDYELLKDLAKKAAAKIK